MTEDARTLTFTVDELVRVLVAEHEEALYMTTTSEIRHRVLRMWHAQQLAPLKSYRPPRPRQYDTGASSWKSPHFTTGASPVGLEIAALIGASAGERVALVDLMSQLQAPEVGRVEVAVRHDGGCKFYAADWLKRLARLDTVRGLGQPYRAPPPSDVLVFSP